MKIRSVGAQLLRAKRRTDSHYEADSRSQQFCDSN